MSFLRNREVPIVGQAVQVHGGFPTVQFSCTCHPAGVPMMIAGFQAVVACPSCRKQFAIGAFVFDRNDPRVRLEIVQVQASKPAPDGPSSSKKPS